MLQQTKSSHLVGSKSFFHIVRASVSSEIIMFSYAATIRSHKWSEAIVRYYVYVNESLTKKKKENGERQKLYSTCYYCMLNFDLVPNPTEIWCVTHEWIYQGIILTYKWNLFNVFSSRICERERESERERNSRVDEKTVNKSGTNNNWLNITCNWFHYHWKSIKFDPWKLGSRKSSVVW